jgi:hypothetical protein
MEMIEKSLARGVPAPRPEVADDVAPSGPALPVENKTSLVNLRETAAYASTFFGLACLVKVYGVARYSTTTTTALITTAPEQVVFGTLAVYVYPTMAILAYGTPWFAVVSRRKLPGAAWPLVVAVTVLTALMTPVEYHLASLTILTVSFLIEVVIRRLPAPHRAGALYQVRRLVSGYAFAYLGGLVLLVGFLATLQSPWASAEVFVVKEPVVSATHDLGGSSDGPVRLVSSAGPFTGYLIGESLTGYEVLNAETRYIMQVEKSQVAARYACHAKGEQLRGRQPLLDRLLGKPYLSPNSDCDLLVAALEKDGVPSGG